MEDFVYPFERLRVYQEARKMVAQRYSVIRNYPSEEKFALCSQMRRCAVSVPSNIAEGTTRTSYKDKIHFLEFAYGSLMELKKFVSALINRVIAESLVSVSKFPTNGKLGMLLLVPY